VDAAALELSCLHNLALRELADDQGRPLLEGLASPERRHGVPLEMRRCPYPGSRHHHPHEMNVSALRQMQEHWPLVLATLAHFRRQHLEETPGPLGRLADLQQVVALVHALPWWLWRRAEASGQPVAPLPGGLSAAFKVVRGLYDLVELLAFKEVLLRAAGQEHGLPRASASWILDELEASGALIGQTEVCAGPAERIREVLELLIEGPGAGASAELHQLLQRLQVDPAAHHRYVAATVGFGIAHKVFEITRRLLVARLRPEQPRLPARLAAALEALEAALPDNPLAEPLADLPLATWGDRIKLFIDLVPTDAPRRALQVMSVALWPQRPTRTRPVAAFIASLPRAQGLAPEVRTALAEHLPPLLECHAAFALLAATTEDELREAVGRSPLEAPARSVLAALAGDPVGQFLEAAFGLQWEGDLGGLRLRAGSRQVPLQ
jgi:hypothetical protein